MYRASPDYIIERRGKIFPFPQHLCDATFVKRGANLHHRTGWNRDGGAGVFRPGDDRLEEFAV